jgi:excisionase family DNA binding protein
MMADKKAQVKPERETFTVEEAGAILGLGRNASYAGAHNGQIPSIRVGKRLLVPRAALEKLLAGGAAA